MANIEEEKNKPEGKIRKLPFDPKQVAEAQAISDRAFGSKGRHGKKVIFFAAGSRDLTKAPPKE